MAFWGTGVLEMGQHVLQVMKLRIGQNPVLGFSVDTHVSEVPVLQHCFTPTFHGTTVFIIGQFEKCRIARL